MKYLPRLIDSYLSDWAESSVRKPLLLRGARQVGKSCAVRNLASKFKTFIEINFERNPEFNEVFKKNLDVDRILTEISILTKTSITDGETLLFFDEIQMSREAIMSLRFFKEDRPGLHVVAAGSLLEFTLAEIPTFGVGRIHSMFMYPMTFDEFLTANNETLLIEARNKASYLEPLSESLHNKLVELFRFYLLVGGMPEAVAKWVETGDYLKCQKVLDDLIVGYEQDFAKYRKKINVELLQKVFRSSALQLTKKFTYADVIGNYSTYEIKDAVNLLCMAGLLTPVKRTDANGIPLGSEVNDRYFKILTLDPGLTLRLLDLNAGEGTELQKEILNQTAADLVNKGPMAELTAGLELLRYRDPNLRHELYYWTRQEKNSVAEIDYVLAHSRRILPLEVKAGTRGGMKSLWLFMHSKHLTTGVRCSLENMGWFEHSSAAGQEGEENKTFKILILPLYAISQLNRQLSEFLR